MSEIAQAYNWIDSTLRADVSLMTASVGGVWQGIADISTVGPHVSYTQQSSADTLTMNAVRLFANILVQIKAVGPSSQYVTLVTIADLIDTDFKRAGPVALASGGVLACWRESTLALEEVVNGAQISHLGGLYRVLLQAS